MKHKHISKLALAAALWLFSCTEAGKRDNPDDPDGINYQGGWVSPSSSSIASIVPSSSSGSTQSIVYGTPVMYEGEIYKTVVIGTQTWMARNLNYGVAGSVCYNKDLANCEKYGKLYTWVTATAVCPSGWHLPSNAEWNTLMTAAGENDLKATDGSGWNNGEDKYGFRALPGGYGDSDGSFYGVDYFGLWWSSEGNNYRAEWGGSIYINSYHNKDYYLFSVRCVKG